MTISRVWPLFSVSIEREDIAVGVMHSVKVPDEKWTFVDKAGHGHFWRLYSKKPSDIPTCKEVVTGTQWVGDEIDGEIYEIKEWQCRTCGQTIEPGYRQQQQPTHVPGPTWVTITMEGREYIVTPEQYAKSVEAWEKALRKISGGTPDSIVFSKTGEQK
jgi:hypothetical protein